MIHVHKRMLKTSAILLAGLSSIRAQLSLLAPTDGDKTRKSSCVYPSGLDANADSAFAVDASALTLPTDDPTGAGVFGAFINAVLPYAGEYETPVQFRNIQWIMAGLWGTTASHHDTALDLFGRGATSRRCTDTPFLETHRLVAFSYAFTYGTKYYFPAAHSGMLTILSSFGLDPNVCDGGKDDCTDTTTPWGLAHTLVEEIKTFSDKDGWNADGSLKGGIERTYNRIPFEDWRTQKFEPDLKSLNSWKPLPESNGKGYLVKQEHVTPHIGDTGKSILLGDDAICLLQAPDPAYDYAVEMQLAIDRSAALDDKKKIEIELFDSKLTSFVPLTAQYYIRSGYTLDSFEFIFSDALLINVLYEATMVVWKEKVRYNAIRPPTIIHRERGEENFNAYAGPYKQPGVIKGSDWQPYVRTMPHAEYPSGSACICTAAREAMIALTGSDDVTTAIQGPLVMEFEAGSSRTEPGSVPAAHTVFTFHNWTSISDMCGQSRLNGGMHFTASVPAGENLCGVIGRSIHKAFLALRGGTGPNYVMDTTSPPQESRTCNVAAASRA